MCVCTWFYYYRSLRRLSKKTYTFRWNRIEFIRGAWYRGRASVQGRNMAVSGSRATRIDVATSFFFFFFFWCAYTRRTFIFRITFFEKKKKKIVSFLSIWITIRNIRLVARIIKSVEMYSRGIDKRKKKKKI